MAAVTKIGVCLRWLGTQKNGYGALWQQDRYHSDVEQSFWGESTNECILEI